MRDCILTILYVVFIVIPCVVVMAILLAADSASRSLINSVTR